MVKSSEYQKPVVVDYGSIQDLTAGCVGTNGDYLSPGNNALTNMTSRGMCTSTPWHPHKPKSKP